MTRKPAKVRKGTAKRVREAPARPLLSDTGKKAVAVDSDSKAGNLRRLRRLEGQIRGVQKMVTEDRYCPDIMIQISAAQEALRVVGRELMRNHLRHCVSEAVIEGPDQANPMFDELLELIYKHSR